MKPTWTIAAVIVMSLMAFSRRSLAAGKESDITITERPGSLEIRVGGNLFATYVFRDKKTLRPYFINVHSSSGIQVTRHHPPRPGKDSTDHAELHPGVWLAFGDISSSSGAAFGVADDTDMTILALLLATNDLTGLGADLVCDGAQDLNNDGVVDDIFGSLGTLDAFENAMRLLANEVYTDINEAGDI